MIKFKNGVYFIDRHLFARGDCFVGEEELNCHYNTVFDTTLIRTKTEDWSTIATPFQTLLDTQNFDDTISVWFYALIGRMLRVKQDVKDKQNMKEKQNVKDNWGKLSFVLSGVPVSGITTTNRTISSLYKLGIKCYGIPEITNANIVKSKSTEFMAKVESSRPFGKRVKNIDSYIVFDYANTLPNITPNLQEQILENYPSFLVKCNLAYEHLAKKFGHETNLYQNNVLPDYFHQTIAMGVIRKI